ncbi:MAG: bifunctional nuclease family protein [Planctomycetes bacterium]|nr:bifunctional nuclease family protein [Planctomycetota bacterium]
MEVRVELSKIIINEAASRQFIVLREVGGKRHLPIVIGMPEAIAIDRRLKGLDLPRPMTHDLLENVIMHLGGEIEKVIINNIESGTFFATLFISLDGKTVSIDSRPSDAIALSAGLKVPLFVDHLVFEKCQP